MVILALSLFLATHSLSITLSHSLVLTLALSHILTLALSHIYKHAHKLMLSHTL